MYSKNYFAAIIVVMMLLPACTSTTLLKTSHPNAKIFADGKYIGEGTAIYSDKKVIGAKTIIEIKNEGSKNVTASISRAEQVNVGALVGGILLSPTIIGLIFFLWVADYNDYYAFDLEKNEPVAQQP